MIAMKNAITGEFETAKVSVYVQKETPKFTGEKFTYLFQAAAVAIGRDITPSASKLLLVVCGIVEYGNEIKKSTAQLADLCKYSKRQVERALNELVDLRILTRSKHPVDGRMTQYYINPLMSWKGNVVDRKNYIKKFNDPDQLTLFESNKTKGIEPNKDF